MAAKVDSAGVQDGFDIYQHSFFVSSDGEWAVVQQGMRDADGTARRYHWLGSRGGDFVDEPRARIAHRARATWARPRTPASPATRTDSSCSTWWPPNPPAPAHRRPSLRGRSRAWSI